MADGWQGFGTQQEDDEKKPGIGAAPEAGFQSASQRASQMQATLGAGGGYKPAGGAGGGSGRFANLQKFLGANKPTALTGAVQSKFGAEAEKTGKAVEAARGKLSSDLQQQQALQQKAQGFASTLEKADASTEDISKLAGDEFGQFLEQKSDLGNINIQDAEKLKLKQANLEGLAKQAQTEKGRFGLLQGLLKRPSYTTGQSKFDQLLLQRGGSGDALQQLQTGLAAGAKASGAGLSSLEGQLSEGLKTYGGDTGKQLAERLKTGLSSQAGALDTTLEEQLTGIKSQESAARDKAALLQKALSGAEQIASLYSDKYKDDPRAALSLATGRTQLSGENLQELNEKFGPGFVEEFKKAQPEVAKLLEGTQFGAVNADMLRNAIANPLSLTNTASMNAAQTMTPEQKARYEAIQKLSKSSVGKFGAQLPNVEAGKQFKFDPVSQEGLASAKAYGAQEMRNRSEQLKESARQLQAITGMDEKSAQAEIMNMLKEGKGLSDEDSRAAKYAGTSVHGWELDPSSLTKSADFSKVVEQEKQRLAASPFGTSDLELLNKDPKQYIDMIKSRGTGFERQQTDLERAYETERNRGKQRYEDMLNKVLRPTRTTRWDKGAFEEAGGRIYNPFSGQFEERPEDANKKGGT
jgi:hypothetical protein